MVIQIQKQSIGLEPFFVCAFTLLLILIIAGDEGGLAATARKTVGQQYLAAVQLHCQQWLNFDIDLNVYVTFV